MDLLKEFFGTADDDAEATQASPAGDATGRTEEERQQAREAKREARRAERQARKADAATEAKRAEFADRYKTGNPSEGFTAEEALEQHRNALAALEKLGPENPDYAECLSALGEDLRHLRRPSEALHYQERALKALGRDGKPLLVGNALIFQGLALLDLGFGRQLLAHEAIPGARMRADQLIDLEVQRR